MFKVRNKNKFLFLTCTHLVQYPPLLRNFVKNQVAEVTCNCIWVLYEISLIYVLIAPPRSLCVCVCVCVCVSVCVCVCVCVCMCACVCVCMWVGGLIPCQGLSLSFLPPYVSQGSNMGWQHFQQVPSLTEPSHQPQFG